ncbi:metal-dependent transcriptional regulator [Staphylococcus phage Twort]|uniref:Metal-dependent transcriptional regulator n=1 Tax=Staphylococcus phage Twort (strain DSM 17442 / HER 48) TaxID=2908167 RepID=A0A6H0X5D0_BPTWO|nr:metal-dependent transcriptional regulator [Staphylococcus phage Twort]
MSKIKRRLYSYLEQYSLKHEYIATTKKELAEKLNISLSALTSNLKTLENEGKIVTSTKRGNNGGFIVTLNLPNTVNEVEGNIIESSKDYANYLKEKVFPTYQYNYKGKRRTKVEMVKYNAIKDKQRKVIYDMNYYLDGLLYPDKELFNLSYDPEGFYKAFILYKLYNQYSAMFCKHKFEETKKDFYTAKMQYYMNYPTPKNFFSTKEFTIFYKLQKLTKEYDINVFKYIQNVFKNVDYEYRNGYKKTYLPQPNYLISEKYIDRYLKYVKGVTKNVNTTQRHVGDLELLVDSSIFTEDLVVQQLHQLYIEGINISKVDINSIFNSALDVEDVMLGLSSNEKQLVLLNFNYEVEQKVSHLPDKNKLLITNYVKQLIINEYDSSIISNKALLSMFTLEREYFVGSKVFNTQESLFKYKDFVGTLNNQGNTLVGYTYLVYRNFNNLMYTIRMYGDLKGYQTNLKDLHNVLEKNNLKGLIPFTKYGTLDYDKLKGRYENE